MRFDLNQFIKLMGLLVIAGNFTGILGCSNSNENSESTPKTTPPKATAVTHIDPVALSQERMTQLEWPLDKIRRRLQNPRFTGRPKIVLLTTGAMNPPHIGHMGMIDLTAEQLEATANFEVVGAFISPSNDKYLIKKFQTGNFLPANVRANMVHAATQSHDFASVATWEANIPNRWPDYPEVAQNLHQVLQTHFPKDALAVMYVCGDDLAKAADLYVKRISPEIGVSIVTRTSALVSSNSLIDGHFLIQRPAQDPIGAISSTKIREAYSTQNEEVLKQYLPSAVVNILLKYGTSLQVQSH